MKEEIPEKPVKLKRMVIPRMTAAQLADKAKAEGDSPEIVRDDITKVTLLDYLISLQKKRMKTKKNDPLPGIRGQ